MMTVRLCMMLDPVGLRCLCPSGVRRDGRNGRLSVVGIRLLGKAQKTFVFASRFDAAGLGHTMYFIDERCHACPHFLLVHLAKYCLAFASNSFAPFVLYFRLFAITYPV